MTMGGDRYNKGKPSMCLLPLDALREICKVYDFGASKYAPWNWAKGLSWSDTQASLMRHLTDWSLGKDKDEESGLYHDVHIAWNAITLVAMRIRGIGKDDRFKLNTITDGLTSTVHPVERNISDTVTPVATANDPTPSISTDNVPDVMGPYDYRTDPRTGWTAEGVPLTGSVKRDISNT